MCKFKDVGSYTGISRMNVEMNVVDLHDGKVLTKSPICFADLLSDKS